MRPVVVLVEDDAMVARAVIRAITPTCDVRHAGTRAIGLVLVAAGGYTVLLCDWDLGYENGADILALSVQLHPAARRVVFSARTVDELRTMAPADVDALLEKPFAIGTLLALMTAQRARRD